MTATTPPSLGIFQDHNQAPQYRITVFPWHAQPFLAHTISMSLEFQTFEDPVPPYLAIFQFSCNTTQLHEVIDRYLEAGYPFAITNFHLKPESDIPLKSVQL